MPPGTRRGRCGGIAGRGATRSRDGSCYSSSSGRRGRRDRRGGGRARSPGWACRRGRGSAKRSFASRRRRPPRRSAASTASRGCGRRSRPDTPSPAPGPGTWSPSRPSPDRSRAPRASSSSAKAAPLRTSPRAADASEAASLTGSSRFFSRRLLFGGGATSRTSPSSGRGDHRRGTTTGERLGSGGPAARCRGAPGRSCPRTWRSGSSSDRGCRRRRCFPRRTTTTRRRRRSRRRREDRREDIARGGRRRCSSGAA
mmetsp:Transcript_25869/g.83784  ORF Transcript_25869/g.83784 Transcript_25869/m.83784 type:complete len:256 (+) Transcript_25869:305-1072(+)